MKSITKKTLIATTIGAAMLVSAGIGAYAASGFTIKVNGKVVDVDARVINGSTYLPLKSIGQLLGAKVGYDAATHTVTVDNGQAPSSSTSTPNSGAKVYPVNVNVTSGPFNMTISKVTVDPAYKRSEYSTPIRAIVLDVKIENTSDQELSWYPEMGEIVTNTKEQLTANSDLSGNYKGRVVKTGKIDFEVKGDLSGITSLSYFIDGAYDIKNYEKVGEDTQTDIILK